MTQLERAVSGELTPEMELIAAAEKRLGEEVLADVAAGRTVIPANPNHKGLLPVGIGAGLRTKVNANIGTSDAYPEAEPEVAKARVAVAAGADTVMDLSTGGNLVATRQAVLSAVRVPLGTVPIYQAAVETIEQRGSLVDLRPDDLFRVIEEQASEGVDFMTVHCGVTMKALERLQKQGRITDIVSRGGAFISGWMLHHQKENPLYSQFDRLLELARRYDVTLSLGDGLRPGCLADATDRAQVEELLTLGELVDTARAAGVQVMVEGPGHVPLNQVSANITLQKSLCRQAPFYVLGPLVTDVAPGYDHITSAIGGALAAAAGADFLCYVTPSEHLGLPSLEDVHEGVMASRLAAHAADLVKAVPGAWEWDLAMARARKALDWKEQLRLALDPEKAARYRQERNASEASTCSMCGNFCAMDIVARYVGSPANKC